MRKARSSAGQEKNVIQSDAPRVLSQAQMRPAMPSSEIFCLNV